VDRRQQRRGADRLKDELEELARMLSEADALAAQLEEEEGEVAARAGALLDGAAAEAAASGRGGGGSLETEAAILAGRLQR
jgi:hypothetical protein